MMRHRNTQRCSVDLPLVLLFTFCLMLLVQPFAFSQESNKNKSASAASSELKPAKTVVGLMQARPGGPLAEVEVEVHAAPTNLPSVDAKDAGLTDDDLVIGIVVDGQPMAYPIRFIAMYEVIDDRVGGTPVAPTW